MNEQTQDRFDENGLHFDMSQVELDRGMAWPFWAQVKKEIEEISTRHELAVDDLIRKSVESGVENAETFTREITINARIATLYTTLADQIILGIQDKLNERKEENLTGGTT